MSISVGVVMDAIQHISIQKDSTFAMLLEAQRRGWDIWYMEQGDLFLEGDRAYSQMQLLQVEDTPSHWHTLSSARTAPLDELDLILMRLDPPFDMEYIYTTYLLEQAEQHGTLVVNRPQSLRDANEKLFTAQFPQCCAPTLVTRSHSRILDFLEAHQEIILKPLGTMGGASIFKVRLGDPNTNVILETLTRHGARFTMAQQFVPEISAGDKRILMVDGEPVPYALARIPKPGETRGNLAAGGTGRGQPLSGNDFRIAHEVGPTLRERGILFAGLDVIGDYLTEINVTSPTCIRELDRQFNLNISATLMDCIEEKLRQRA